MKQIEWNILACFVRVSNIFYKALTSGNKNFYNQKSQFNSIFYQGVLS
ncbi:hypothetical protein N207_05125 [Helicobacter pylori UM114]|uniref:Uncharacterized protein n=1 Tax=Helicobacter pylori UM114 TaxID=1355531 RepID=T0F6D2_HELPX|nr:hypothetical protein N207_05125 [Helicobacter pylori UM114]